MVHLKRCWREENTPRQALVLLALLLLLFGPCYFSFVNCTQQYPHYVRWCTLLFLRRSFLKRYQEEVYLVEWERITEKEKGTSSKINAADLYSTTQHGALCILSYSIMFNLISTDLFFVKSWCLKSWALYNKIIFWLSKCSCRQKLFQWFSSWIFFTACKMLPCSHSGRSSFPSEFYLFYSPSLCSC